MRNKEGYTKQCMYINASDISESEKLHYSKVYGINRSPILLELPYFDVTQHLPQDLMHVLLEGVFPLHVGQLLQYVIHESKILTLSQINSRILAHPYAYFEEKPSPLKDLEFEGSQSGYSASNNIYQFILFFDLFSCSDVGTDEHTSLHYRK